MREATIPMFFPALGAYINNTRFMYPDNTCKEVCGLMCHLVGESGMGKGQLTNCVEAVMRKFRLHDEEKLQELVDWQRSCKAKGPNKGQPVRPNISFWFPPYDVTNAAFLQNAMACEDDGNHLQYYNMPEIEMANKMCGSHSQVSQVIRNIYDCQRAGALRATAEGVTGNPTLRVNINFSSTPFAARKFYKSELYVGTLGRVVFSYKPRKERIGVIPRQGSYDSRFLHELDGYIERLEACKGEFTLPQLNSLADRMAADMATMADLTDNDVLWDLSKRAIVNGWKCGCILCILNGMKFTRPIGELVEWMVYYDLWSKMQIFGDMLNGGDPDARSMNKGGIKNMLEDLPDSFNEAQLEALRVNMGKEKDAKKQLNVWKNRGFIDYSSQTGLYTKTESYLKRSR